MPYTVIVYRKHMHVRRWDTYRPGEVFADLRMGCVVWMFNPHAALAV